MSIIFSNLSFNMRLVSRCSKYFIPKRNINSYRNVLCNNRLLVIQNSEKLPALTSNPILNLYTRRNYCDEKFTESKTVPRLMDFPEIIWPSFFKFARNWMFTHFIIRPHFDPEFNIPDFIEGSKHAVQVVSEALYNGDFDSLKGLVVDEAITELQTAISKLSVAQREVLIVEKEDIFYAYPYQIGVMFGDSDKRWVEITMCFHMLRGLKAMRETGDLPPVSLGFQPEYQDKLYIMNYRFIREYTKGVNDTWWINIINHFKPSDLMRK